MERADTSRQPRRGGAHRQHLRPGRRRHIQIRLDDNEYAAIAAAAADIGLTPTGYTAEVVVATARGTSVEAQALPTSRLTWLAQVQRELFIVRIALIDIAAANHDDQSPIPPAMLISRCADAVQRLDDAVAEIDRRLR